MSTITTLVGTDGITTGNSMTKINTNFSNLNTDKIETSTLDTDTTLAANSDSKIPTQKAVKAYVDAGGNVNASETARGIVEEATDAEVSAGTATGATGAKLFITPAKLATRLSSLSSVVNVYSTQSTSVGSSTTQFDITNTSGTTYRYTYDGTGTDPSFSAANYPVGTGIQFNAQNFNANNNGVFTVTASGTNYVEVTNASGVAENNKTIGTGFILKGTYWTKPAGLKCVEVEVIGAGGGGGGSGGSLSGGTSGGTSYFGSTLYASGGSVASGGNSGSPGTGSGGDFNGAGQYGSVGIYQNSSGIGGSSIYGGGGSYLGGNASGYGGGGGGAQNYSSGTSGGGGGGGGGYSRKIITTASLSSTMPIIIGIAGTGQGAYNNGGNGTGGLVIVTEIY